jgi:hypothetical protein
MKRVFDEITSMETYERVPSLKALSGSFGLPGKWVYMLKLDKNNIKRRFKAL